MTEEELHPTTNRLDGKKSIGSFENFGKFIHVEELDAETGALFRSFLHDLYVVSSKVWRPTGCHSCSFLEEKANQLLREQEYSGLRVKAKTRNRAHFWLEASVKETGALIIDPFGVPTPGKDYHKEDRTVVPFFGDRKYASEHAQEVYNGGTDLGEKGYYVFHP